MINLGPVPKPKLKGKPKPKKIFTIDGEEIFYDWDLILEEYPITPVEVWGWVENDGYAPLLDQSINLADGRVLTTLNGYVSSISTVVQ
jgi:hypothetical protein